METTADSTFFAQTRTNPWVYPAQPCRCLLSSYGDPTLLSQPILRRDARQCLCSDLQGFVSSNRRSGCLDVRSRRSCAAPVLILAHDLIQTVALDHDLGGIAVLVFLRGGPYVHLQRVDEI